MKKSLFILLLITGSFAVNAQKLSVSQSELKLVNDVMLKYGRLLFLLSSSYVDTVNIQALSEKMISKLLGELDPHSSYTPAKDAKATTEAITGNFDGIGIEFNIMEDTLLIVSPIAGGPAQRLGIQAGDRIIDVDGKNIAGVGLKNTEVQKLLKGPKGTIVNVKVLRRNTKDLLDFSITRDKIPLYSLDAKFWAAPGIAYIRLGRFAGTTHKEFQDALIALGKKPKGLILDLRANSGGLFDAATRIADEFMEKDQLIVYNEGRAIPRTDFMSTDTLSKLEQAKVVVLIDEGSASASEILAGAIQDWDRGVIVGRRSFGKGLVQNQIELPDASLVRVTVARYHTPTGRMIQRPYNNGKIEQYYNDLYKRFSNGELYSPDSMQAFPDSLKFLTLKNKRNVYGGGGIMPDIFVPVDTSNYSKYHSRLVRMGILNQFTLQYNDKNREFLKKRYKNISQFKEKFEVTEELLEELVVFAEKKKLERNEAELIKSKIEICTQLKGLIAQELFSTGAYYEVVYPQIDQAYQKALDIMQNWTQYEHILQ
ncbi:MAG: S41 family peptidase [Bacteroidales bacterium]